MLQQQVDGIMKLIQSHNQVPNRQGKMPNNHRRIHSDSVE